jgi:hypothetical protein
MKINELTSTQRYRVYCLLNNKEVTWTGYAESKKDAVKEAADAFQMSGKGKAEPVKVERIKASKYGITEEQIIDEKSAMNLGITAELRAKGYQELGSGLDQTAFLEPNTGLVLKIFGTQQSTHSDTGQPIFSRDQQMFFKFANFCMQQQDNPFLPKFFGFESFIYDNKTYLQIRQERLEQQNNTGDIVSEIGYAITGSGDSAETMSDKDAVRVTKQFSPSTYDYLKNQMGENSLYQLIATILELYKIAKQSGFRWDLHARNIMIRKNGTPVLVDPWNLRSI